MSSSEQPPAPGPLERPPKGLLGAPRERLSCHAFASARPPGRHHGRGPSGPPPQWHPTERPPSHPLFGGRGQEHLTERPHRRPLLGGSSTGAPHRVIPDAPPRRNTREAHPGDRRHGPSSEEPRQRKPREGPPRPGSSEPRQEADPGQAHRRCHRGASPVETPRGLHHPWHPTERPTGSPPRRKPPGPSPRGFTATPSSEGAAAKPLTGSHPSPSLLGERGQGHPHGLQTGQPLLGEAHGPQPTEAVPQAGSSEPTQGATSRAPPPRSPKRHPPGGSSEPLSGSRFRSPRPGDLLGGPQAPGFLGEQLLEWLLGASPRCPLPSRPVRTAHRQGRLGRTRMVAFLFKGLAGGP